MIELLRKILPKKDRVVNKHFFTIDDIKKLNRFLEEYSMENQYEIYTQTSGTKFDAFIYALDEDNDEILKILFKDTNFKFDTKCKYWYFHSSIVRTCRETFDILYDKFGPSTSALALSLRYGQYEMAKKLIYDDRLKIDINEIMNQNHSVRAEVIDLYEIILETRNMPPSSRVKYLNGDKNIGGLNNMGFF